MALYSSNCTTGVASVPSPRIASRPYHVRTGTRGRQYDVTFESADDVRNWKDDHLTVRTNTGAAIIIISNMDLLLYS